MLCWSDSGSATDLNCVDFIGQKRPSADARCPGPRGYVESGRVRVMRDVRQQHRQLANIAAGKQKGFHRKAFRAICSDFSTTFSRRCDPFWRQLSSKNGEKSIFNSSRRSESFVNWSLAKKEPMGILLWWRCSIRGVEYQWGWHACVAFALVIAWFMST